MKTVRLVGSDPSVDGSFRADHQVQMGLVRALKDALPEDSRNGKATEIYDQLKVYTGAHFLSEQLLMRLHGYADYEQHCQEHEELLEALDAAQSSLQVGTVANRLNTLKIIEDSLTRHIATSDVAFERFVSATSG